LQVSFWHIEPLHGAGATEIGLFEQSGFTRTPVLEQDVKINDRRQIKTIFFMVY